MRMVITDLDGTLLDSNGKLSSTNFETLLRLRREKIPVAVATGRSLYSARKVLDEAFPIDYLIFSTGAGIMDWHTKQIIRKNSLRATVVASVVSRLCDHNITFMLHREIPDNHCFYYFEGGMQVPDYKQRLHIYRQYAQPFDLTLHGNLDATQFVLIFNDTAEYLTVEQLMREHIEGVSLIRATSPLNGQSVWLEIFPQGVTKSDAAKYLTSLLAVNRQNTMVVGNDWNDEDLLEWGRASYVVANAPLELKAKYPVVPSNENDGFSVAVNQWLNDFR